MYRFSREGREIAVISLFAAPFARVGAIGRLLNNLTVLVAEYQ